MCLALAAGAVHAETPASPKPAIPIRPTSGTSLIADVKSHDLAAFAAKNLHTTPPSAQLRAEILAALAAPDPSAPAAGGTYAAGTAAPSATPSAPAGSDAPAMAGPQPGAPDAKTARAILDFSPLNRVSGIATGLSTGTMLPVPNDAALAHDAASAIVRAFRAGPGTADQAASDAADAATTGDPAMDERITLARTVFKVDGSDELVRRFVATELMRLVIGEVAKHIDINKLSETDKYRLSAVAAAAQTELEEKILNLNARVEAAYLSKSDLTQLIVAYDNDAVRKQTKLRLADTGKIDRGAALDITMAQYQIVKLFESAQ